MSALMIANINIKDQAKFEEYIAKTRNLAALYGAELVYRGKTGRVLAGGENDHGLVIIVKFPSLDKINEWFDSDDYQALVPLRQAGAEMKMTAYQILP